VRTVNDVRETLSRVRAERRGVALVPTMGALHAGHASLIEKAHLLSDFVVVSIFVNPLQFGPNEDYQRYPRPLEKDLEVCERKGADLVFVPEVADLYPSEQKTFVEVTRLGDHLCGKFRPGHFRGVATVVAKLFNIIRPDRAYFGEKDYQQLCIIRRMTQDLNLSIEIIPVPTYREVDGLALSSRNVYLNPEERALAPMLYRSLMAAREMIENGEREPRVVRESAQRTFAAEPRVRLEYFEIVDPLEVEPVGRINEEVRIAAAVWIGKTRLIDNVPAKVHT
jgi:pantoate--beta-alanine ligase